ncbi:MAG: hypothetical protein Q8N36_01425 [bacterium]|nr:hypothetical protein [bacterium]
MSLSYKITGAGFNWLSQAFPKKTLISPLAMFANATPSHAGLVAQGIISADGTIMPSALAVLKVLSEPDAYSRIKILGTNSAVDKITYFLKDSTCSVDAEADAFMVSFPAMSKEATFVMEEFSGSSRITNCSVNAKLSKLQSLVFLAIVDIIRSRALMLLAGEQSDLACTIEQILYGANRNSSYFSLARGLKDLTSPAEITLEAVTTALSGLIAKNLVSERDGKYLLVGDALELATNFLIPEYWFNITYGRMMPDNLLQKSECNVAFCGMHNLLYIELDGENVDIETISGSELIQIIANAMTSAPPA